MSSPSARALVHGRFNHHLDGLPWTDGPRAPRSGLPQIVWKSGAEKMR
jgi:hypothetical protein